MLTYFSTDEVVKNFKGVFDKLTIHNRKIVALDMEAYNFYHASQRHSKNVRGDAVPFDPQDSLEVGRFSPIGFDVDVVGTSNPSTARTDMHQMEAPLVSASISFDTYAYLDGDTTVIIHIKEGVLHKVVARLASTFGQLAHRTDIPVAVLKTCIKRHLMSTGHFGMELLVLDSETWRESWRFNWTVDMEFADESHELARGWDERLSKTTKWLSNPIFGLRD
ncbi:hypothetical protein JCM24511_10161 [Saitozyma sp. JCM 24511]|nr:hypothetical protein JCM24511_10161 [Saitozyma sp. JCM 24511]